MTTRDESMRRHPSARFFGTAQTLTPTFSHGGVEVPLANAQHIADGYGVVEHLGFDAQLTIRARTEGRVQVPPFSYDDFMRVLALAVSFLAEGAK